MRKIIFALALALPLTWSLASFAQDPAPAAEEPAKEEKKVEKKAEKKADRKAKKAEKKAAAEEKKAE